MSIIFKESFFKELGTIELDKPTGQLSGHNAGEPFSEKIYKFLKERKKENIFKQFEYLNKILKENNKKKEFFNSTFGFIIHRGKKALKEWSEDKPFTEKQNDTADILYIDDKTNGIIDIKTTNIEKKGQPPNIISSLKVAKICKRLIENKDDEKIEFNYVGIDWQLKNNKLISHKISVIDLFKIDPKTIYINWAAALQIQFHVNKVDQSYTNNKIDWAKDYLKKFSSSGKERIISQQKNFIDPFKDLIND